MTAIATEAATIAPTKLAAHPSRHRVLTDCLDAAIFDENDPTRRDPELDLFARTPPFDEAFLALYRAAQEARNRRITSWVKAQLRSMPDHEERIALLRTVYCETHRAGACEDRSDRASLHGTPPRPLPSANVLYAVSRIRSCANAYESSNRCTSEPPRFSRSPPRLFVSKTLFFAEACKRCDR